MTSYNQLTYGVRCQIYALKKTGMSQNKIARQRRVNQSTISRELLRNSGQRGYRYKQAHDMAIARRLNAPKASSILLKKRFERIGAQNRYLDGLLVKRNFR
ncbi:helix-turn-helix domain-containing protein [Marinomonas sp. IMCC 4694]|uniref:helix-turn-helix domain-containing protein n=1 Tax=Marinomonas sp. IMCC 4694 TaxID=2605432 RepID=UPI0011E77FED|nr:helix-turn-helix domain-containing protein [Marinomonas sp. IMCC 4694]